MCFVLLPLQLLIAVAEPNFLHLQGSARGTPALTVTLYSAWGLIFSTESHFRQKPLKS